MQQNLKFFVSLLTFLTACSGNAVIEGWFSPDPQLTETPSPINSPSLKSPDQPRLPDSFPSAIPLYSPAQLAEANPAVTGDSGKTRWTSTDPSNLIVNFYQREFEANNWEIVQPFSSDTANREGMAIVRRDGLEVEVAILPPSSTSRLTEFTIEYQTNSSTPTTTSPGTATAFSDLDRLPQPLQQYLQDLANLGVVQANQGTQFNPDQPVTRRQYARWLVTANNALHANVASKQIRLGSKTDSPAFQDLPTSDPDFPIIQGLAQAGWIPSPLTGDSTASLFRPDRPLTREDLILWKVPLDYGKALPGGTIEKIKESWGFQDAAKISPKAMGALYSDFQNGEQANVRRVFGYTTLFQPKKSVTRAEAAASLWYFGFQGEGISAKEARQIQQ